MVEIRWSLQAADELEEICVYFDKNSPHYSKLFAFKIVESIQKLKNFPKIGKIVPEIDNPNIREIFYNLSNNLSNSTRIH